MLILLKANSVRLLCLITVIGLLLSLFVGGAQPAAGALFIPPWDKVAHAGFYLVLYLLVKEILGISSWIVVLVVLFVGMMDEFHQISLPFRHAGWDDLAADFFGIVYGVIIRRALAIIE